MSVPAGTYAAKAAGMCVLGESKEKHTPFLELYFMITKGDHNGEMVRWTSYFTDKTSERTIESMRACGWVGDDLSVFVDNALHGLDSVEVSIVVEIETFKVEDGSEHSAPRVKWVNKASGQVKLDAAMSPAAAKDFGARMRGLTIASKPKANASKPASETEDKIPF